MKATSPNLISVLFKEKEEKGGEQGIAGGGGGGERCNVGQKRPELRDEKTGRKRGSV